MKKHKMLITLAGLAVAVTTTATVAAYTLAGDGPSTAAGESAGTREPGFQNDKLLNALDTIDDGKGSVSVINPDVKVDDPPPLHGDPPPPQPVNGTDVPGTEPVIEPTERGDVGPTDNSNDPAGSSPPPLKDDLEDSGDQVVRVGSGTGLLIDPLLSTGADAEVTAEVV